MKALVKSDSDDSRPISDNYSDDCMDDPMHIDAASSAQMVDIPSFHKDLS